MSTTTSKQSSDLSGLRLRAEVPHTDESISSTIDRAASLWGISRRDLIRQLGHEPNNRDLDTIVSMPLLQSISNAFGVDPAVFGSIAVLKSRQAVLVAPDIRHAYCPLCFEDDWQSGDTPYFRLDWGRLFASHCRTHRTPLFEWEALSRGGQRRLPHAYHLPFEEAADLPLWIINNYQEALSWQLVGDADADTHTLWRALLRVEELWWEEGLGDPGRVTTEAVRRREQILVNLAALFLAAPDLYKPCLVERLFIPPHQHRVLGYDRRRHNRGMTNPGGIIVRRQLPAIQARRIMFILTAHTLGQLDTDLRFETGARIPSGSSNEWVSHVLEYRVARNLAKAHLRAAKNW